MVYIRSKIVKGKEYFYLVKGININGKMKQKHIAYIGDKEDLIKLQQNIENKLN